MGLLTKRTPNNLQIKGEMPAAPSAKDEQGHTQEKPTFVFVQIRQKPLIGNEEGQEGKIIKEPGKFKFTDDREDVKSLTGIIVCTQQGRAFFPTPESMTTECKSMDGIQGVSGKTCVNCEKSYWIAGKKPKCYELRNILLLPVEKDLKNDTEPLILTIHGASMSSRLKNAKPERTHYLWRELNMLLKKHVPPVPIHYVIAKIGSVYQKDPQPHFVTVFGTERFLTKDEHALVQKKRDELLKALFADVEKAGEELRVDEERSDDPEKEEDTPF